MQCVTTQLRSTVCLWQRPERTWHRIPALLVRVFQQHILTFYRNPTNFLQRKTYLVNMDDWSPNILFTLDWAIYVADKEQCRTETNGPQHEKEGIANASHVTKEKWRLHEARHVWSRIIVIEAVSIDEQPSWATAKKRSEGNRIQIAWDENTKPRK